MASKFDQIIESIVNGDEKKARSLFHNFVVNRSRRIYEDLEQHDPANSDEGADDFIDEVEMEQNHGVQEDGDDFGDTSEDFSDDEFGGDQADDLVSDVGDDFANAEADVDDFSSDATGSDVENADMEDRVVDLEDELDSLKAEFAKLMGDEESEDGESDDFGGDDFSEDSEDTDSDDDFAGEDEDSDEDESDDFEDSDNDDDFDGVEEDTDEDNDTIREYVEKVAKPSNSEEGSTNKKSIVAGKNDMGGTNKNIATGSGDEKGRPTPSSKPLSSDKFVNVPGGGRAKLNNAPKPKTGEESGTNKKSTY